MSQINYVRIINRYFPDRECYSTGPNYSDIVWTDGQSPVTQGALDVKHLLQVKWEAEETIKGQAAKKRDEVYAIVLGTDDPSLIRIYEQKEKEARYYRETVDASGTPESSKIYLLEKEALNLGMTTSDLADAVIAQADAANAQILPMIGEIEGIRRAKQFQVANASTDTDVDNIMAVPITWPDTSTLVLI